MHPPVRTDCFKCHRASGRVNGRLKEAALAQKRKGAPPPYIPYNVRLPRDPSEHNDDRGKSSRKGRSNPLIGSSRIDRNGCLRSSRCIMRRQNAPQRSHASDILTRRCAIIAHIVPKSSKSREFCYPIPDDVFTQCRRENNEKFRKHPQRFLALEF